MGARLAFCLQASSHKGVSHKLDHFRSPDDELKSILARQPGPEVAEQLSIYHKSLAERAKQIEQMEAELSLSYTQASEYKFEIGRVNKELREVKKKFFEQKKREQLLQEARRAERAQPTDLLVQEARSTLNRFTGGGFNLNYSNR